jgi:hypothetical protein
MSDFEKATRVFDALKVAEGQPAQQALPILNGLVALVQGSGEQSLEVGEARSGASWRSVRSARPCTADSLRISFGRRRSGQPSDGCR